MTWMSAYWLFLSLVAVAYAAWLSFRVYRAFLRLPRKSILAFLFFSAVATVVAQKPPAHMPRSLPVSDTVTDGDIERGYALVGTIEDAGHSFAMPTNATIVGNWHKRGTFGEWLRLELGGLEFPMGTNGALYSSFSVFNDGKIRPTPRDTAHEISAVGVPMLAMQGASRFWTMDSDDGSKLLTWENFFLNADTNAPVNAQIRLCPGGGFTARSNEVARQYRRINAHDIDGDGLANEIDPMPRHCDGDFFGTSPEWRELECGGIGNSNAYYFAEFSATGSVGVARVDVVCDGTSNLGDMTVIARSGQTCRVPLLIGADYEIVSDLPFEAFSLSDTNAVSVALSNRRIHVSYPLRFSFMRMDGDAPPLLRGAPPPDEDEGGAKTNIWRFDVRPVDPGIEILSVTGACCNAWIDEALFFWECEDDCSCNTNRPEILRCMLAWEGHTNKFNYALECPCRESEMDDWHVGSPALWIDMPETLFVKNDDTNDFSDVVNLTVGWAAVGATNGTVELDMRFQGDDAAVYADQELTERVPLPLLMDGSEPCETNFYIVGLRESTAYANNAVTLAWHDGGGNLLGRTERSFTVLCPIADVVNNSLYSGGELCNPAAIVAGTNAPFAITFSSLYPPEETIVWSVEEGDAEFVGGVNTGLCVRVSSLATNTAVTLNVQIGDAISRPVKFRAYVVEPFPVKTTVWIVRDDRGNNAARTFEDVTNIIAEVNKIYWQVGVSFYIDSISFTNRSEFLDLSKKSTSTRNNVAAVKYDCSLVTNVVAMSIQTGGIEIYFVKKIANRIRGLNNPGGAIISENGDARTVAHELGHASGLDDIYPRNRFYSDVLFADNSVFASRVPEDWNNGAGCRYYSSQIKLEALIKRHVMCGFHDAMARDVSAGEMYGFDGSSYEDMVDVGFFTSSGRRTPSHR